MFHLLLPVLHSSQFCTMLAGRPQWVPCLVYGLLLISAPPQNEGKEDGQAHPDDKHSLRESLGLRKDFVLFGSQVKGVPISLLGLVGLFALPLEAIVHFVSELDEEALLIILLPCLFIGEYQPCLANLVELVPVRRVYRRIVNKRKPVVGREHFISTSISWHVQNVVVVLVGVHLWKLREEETRRRHRSHAEQRDLRSCQFSDEHNLIYNISNGKIIRLRASYWLAFLSAYQQIICFIQLPILCPLIVYISYHSRQLMKDSEREENAGARKQRQPRVIYRQASPFEAKHNSLRKLMEMRVLPPLHPQTEAKRTIQPPKQCCPEEFQEATKDVSVLMLGKSEQLLAETPKFSFENIVIKHMHKQSNQMMTISHDLESCRRKQSDLGVTFGKLAKKLEGHRYTQMEQRPAKDKRRKPLMEMGNLVKVGKRDSALGKYDSVFRPVGRESPREEGEVVKDRILPPISSKHS